MKTRFSFLLLAGAYITALLSVSCGKTTDEIPAFIRIDSTFIEDSKFGDITSEIYALKVNVDGEDRGIWEIPFRLPVITEGSRNVIFEPFVKQNNLSLEYIENPNLKPYVNKWSFSKGVEIDSVIGFYFEDSTDLLFSEKFEGTNNFSNSSVNAGSPYGNCIVIDANNNSSDSSTVSTYIRTIAFDFSSDYMLEFDYYMPKGVFTPVLSYFNASNQRVDLFGKNFLLSNSRWTHVYWNLNDVLAGQSIQNYYITFILTTARGESDAKVFIDNVNIFEK